MNSMLHGESYDKYLERQGAFSDTDPKELARVIEKDWRNYEWGQGEWIDGMPEEHENYYVMTCEVDGMTFEGTGIYSCGELILIENVEHKIN